MDMTRSECFAGSSSDTSRTLHASLVLSLVLATYVVGSVTAARARERPSPTADPLTSQATSARTRSTAAVRFLPIRPSRLWLSERCTIVSAERELRLRESIADSVHFDRPRCSQAYRISADQYVDLQTATPHAEILIDEAGIA